jgi:hypothetical protein
VFRNAKDAAAGTVAQKAAPWLQKRQPLLPEGLAEQIWGAPPHRTQQPLQAHFGLARTGALRFQEIIRAAYPSSNSPQGYGNGIGRVGTDFSGREAGRDEGGEPTRRR